MAEELRFPKTILTWGSPWVLSKGYFFCIEAKDGEPFLMWERGPTERLRGEIATWQESVPCAESKVWKVTEEGAPVAYYGELERVTSVVELKLCIDSQWWEVTYEGGEFASAEKIAPPQPRIADTLKISDDCELLVSLAERMSAVFPD